MHGNAFPYIFFEEGTSKILYICKKKFHTGGIIGVTGIIFTHIDSKKKKKFTIECRKCFNKVSLCLILISKAPLSQKTKKL